MNEEKVLVCPVCGKEHTQIYYSKHSGYEDLCGSKECYSTVYWVDLIENYDNTRHFIINGSVYELGDGKGWDKGFGGRKFIIRPNQFNGDKSKDIVTTDLWLRGEVPNRFKKQLPDNAVFVIE